MRIRPPSFGFAYLVLAIVAFVGYFAYIQKADWWQLPEGRSRDLAESRYLLTLIDGATPGQRITWLGEAMVLASKHAEWSLAESIFLSSIAHKAKLKPQALTETIPGRCWVAGPDVTTGAVRQAPVAFFANNNADAWTLRTEWCADRDGAIETRAVGGQWQAHNLTAGVNTVVEWRVPAGGVSHWEVRGVSRMFAAADDSQDPAPSGIQLKSAGVKQ